MLNPNLQGQINQPTNTSTTTTSYYQGQSSSIPQYGQQTQTRATTVPLGSNISGGLTGQQNLLGYHTVGKTGEGTITFRPIEGRFNKDKDPIGKMDPYVKFKIGWRSGKSSVAKSQGTHPTWVGDAIVLKLKNHECAKLKVKDKDRMGIDDRLGTAEIPLAPVVQQGTLVQWIPITNKGVVTGEIQVEMTFTPK